MHPMGGRSTLTKRSVLGSKDNTSHTRTSHEDSSLWEIHVAQNPLNDTHGLTRLVLNNSDWMGLTAWFHG